MEALSLGYWDRQQLGIFCPTLFFSFTHSYLLNTAGCVQRTIRTVWELAIISELCIREIPRETPLIDAIRDAREVCRAQLRRWLLVGSQTSWAFSNTVLFSSIFRNAQVSQMTFRKTEVLYPTVRLKQWKTSLCLYPGPTWKPCPGWIESITTRFHCWTYQHPLQVCLMMMSIVIDLQSFQWPSDLKAMMRPKSESVRGDLEFTLSSVCSEHHKLLVVITSRDLQMLAMQLAEPVSNKSSKTILPIHDHFNNHGHCSAAQLHLCDVKLPWEPCGQGSKGSQL